MHPLNDFAAELPDGAFWMTGKLMKRLISLLVADRVRPGSTINETPTSAGRFWEAQGGAGDDSDAISFPWQCALSPWTGTGTDPHAADRVLRFKISYGKFSGRTPTNPNVEMLAFGDATDAEIEEADAVITQVYLQVPISETALGQGDVTVSRPTINIVEGADLVDALSGAGTAVPTPPTDGSLPAYIVVALAEVSWWGGALHFNTAGQYTNLDLIVSVSGTLCGSASRTIAVVGVVAGD